MSQQIGVYLSYKDVAGRPCTYPEFLQRLSHYSRDEVIYVCSLLNALLQTWSDVGSTDVHCELVSNAFIPGRLRDWLTQMVRNPQQRHLIFHRRRLLLVAKEAACVCTNEGAAILNDASL